MQTIIDYRDNLWLISAPGLGGQMGFWTLASAKSFATNNLRASFVLTNQAIVRAYADLAAAK